MGQLSPTRSEMRNTLIDLVESKAKVSIKLKTFWAPDGFEICAGLLTQNIKNSLFFEVEVFQLNNYYPPFRGSKFTFDIQQVSIIEQNTIFMDTF